MSDQFITVATFNKTFEAQLARNLLENEGIESVVGGAFASDVLLGSMAVSDPITLQVREADAQRAAGILAQAAAEARLEDDWEQQAESGAGVWLCSICGEPVSDRLSVCYSCQTPREGIRAAPRPSTSIQPQPVPPPRHDEARTDAAPAPPADDAPPPPAARGDDLARRAFLAAIAGTLFPLLLPLTWFYVLRAALHRSETSPRGLRHFYLALGVACVPTVLLAVLIGWRL